MYHIRIILLSFFLFTSILFSQEIKEVEHKIIFSNVLNVLSNIEPTEFNNNKILRKTAEYFIGTDYEANSLETNEEENLVINLTGLDCTTFIENVLAISGSYISNKISFDDYKNRLTRIRYRNGIIKGYVSRLHYFSDWIIDNQKKGLVNDITENIGGIPYSKEINFMSSNYDKYSKLKNNFVAVDSIKRIEAQINKHQLFYIPKLNVKNVYRQLSDGDIIAITTSIKGLDISHVGMAVINEGKVYLLHAPDIGYKVQITKKDLHQYLASNKKQTGIIVLRPIFNKAF